MTAPSFPSQGEWDSLGQKLGGIPGQANSAIEGIYNLVNDILSQWWCPGWVADWVKPILDKLVALTKAILTKLAELIVGFAFPLVAFFVANDWNDMVKNPVNKVAGEVADGNLHVADYWQGTAATAYTNALKAQTDAMTEVGAIVGDLQLRLWVIAGLLFTFYIAVSVVLIQWIAVMIAASAADATGIGAILGIPVQVGDTAVSGGAVAALIAALVAVIGAELQSYTTLNGRIANSQKLPNGNWPVAVADVLGDASETGKDGHIPNWRIK
jgi:hypothetical protein